jgi:hypothetical protein
VLVYLGYRKTKKEGLFECLVKEEEEFICLAEI